MPGFSLLPLKQDVLNNTLKSWDSKELSVLIVLIAHANSLTRISCPSQERIAILAGVRKADIGRITGILSERGWLTIRRIQAMYCRSRLEYKMTYREYKGDDRSITKRVSKIAVAPPSWLRIDNYIVTNGLWAEMTPSARKLYLTLIALSIGNFGADYAEGVSIYDDLADLDEGRFVEGKYLSPSLLRELSGLPERTFRRAWDNLFRLGLVRAQRANGATGYASGLLLTYDPAQASQDVMRRIREAKARATEPPKVVSNLLARGSRVQVQDSAVDIHVSQTPASLASNSADMYGGYSGHGGEDTGQLPASIGHGGTGTSIV